MGKFWRIALRSGALASQNPAVSPYMKEALAGEGAVPEGMDLVGEVLAMAQSPGNTVETTPGGFRVPVYPGEWN